MDAKGRYHATHGLVTGIGLTVIHLGACLAFIPAFTSWSAVIVAFVLYYITGAIGVTLGYHRVLTHRSARLAKPLEYLATFCGVLALQGGPIDWVATHRAHHAHTDADGDPHDGRKGLWWTHVAWLYMPNESRLTPAEMVRMAPDLANDPFFKFMERTTLMWQVVLGVVLFALGGWSWVVWGIFVRLVAVYHITWAVNSFTHSSGYRTFKTGDLSTNNWMVGLLAWGEGWHNNHHAFPFSARHGLRWFEIDMTWMTIRFLRAVRLARDVKLPSAQMLSKLAFDPAPFVKVPSDRAA